MRIVLQRVSSSSVTVDGRVVGSIGHGLLLLIGIETADTAADGEWLAAKISKLRLFDDAEGRMNLSLLDPRSGPSTVNPHLANGLPQALVVSQFTLHASTAKGSRPSFHAAARPEIARPLYELFINQLEQVLARPVQTGEFGAMMEVAITNSGPVTLILDSKSRV